MRFVIAIVLFVVAFVGIGVGIAQRTILAGPSSISTGVVTDDAPVTVISAEALNAFPLTQKLEVSGSDEIFMAYGRTSDVLGWVGDASYNMIGFDAETQQLTSKLTTGTEDTVPSPVDSDLWLQQFEGTDELTRRINPPADISVILTADGEAAAPNDVTITWPLDNSAPLSGPIIIGGIVALVLGLLAFVWALVHARRSRGPRRKQPRLRKPPSPPRLKRGPKRAAITAGLLMASLVLTGCTAGDLRATPDPAATPSAALEDDLPPTAVTEQQLRNIMDKVVESTTAADAARDATLAGARLAGPALALRAANYKIVTADAALAPIAAIPNGDIDITLPQQSETWPRTVLAVVTPSDTALAPIAMLLQQESARENYKVHYLITLEPDIVFPKVAPAAIGAVALNPDNTLALVRPDELATAYGDILAVGETSPFFAQFDPEGDALRVAIGADKKAERKAALPASATITFTHAVGTEAPISFPTNDSGQIVAVALDDTETVTPVEAGAAVNPQGAIKALSGVTQSTKGVTATYGVQMLFYVPGLADPEAKIKLLGFTQGLVSAAEVP